MARSTNIDTSSSSSFTQVPRTRVEGLAFITSEQAFSSKIASFSEQVHDHISNMRIQP
jgi:hypothetical protein